MNIIFNPAYYLKPDTGRTLILSTESLRENKGGEDNFTGFIHPIHAMILSFFDGSTDYESAISRAAEYLGIGRETVEKFTTPLIANESRYSVTLGNVMLIFPENVLIYSNDRRKDRVNPEEFLYEKLDLRIKRHATPSDITLMVNNRCATDCIYCYADRREVTDCQVPFERLCEIIEEARDFKARSLNVIGGEFFLYKHWKELLIKLKECGFSPFLSTKLPIGESIVAGLAEIGVEDLQISLDTMRNDNLQYILKVKPNYWDQMRETFRLLERYKVPVMVHTILTSRNHFKEDMESIYDFIKQFGNIVYWRPDIASGSIYLDKTAFPKIRAASEQLKEVYQYLEQIRKNDKPHFDIKTGGVLRDEEPAEMSWDEKKEAFVNRGFCTANYAQCFILPDGKVTTCEELYWHPQFTIGNIKTQGLREIWNSETATDLVVIPQYKIGADSPCSSCPDYYNCRETKGVCYKDIIKAYGEDKWYYPDVKCPKAPEPVYEFN